MRREAPDQRLPKSRRLRKRSEYLKLQRTGRRRGRGRFVIITAAAPTGVSRIGITASRRVGGAVTRNRTKRIVREFFRRYQYEIQPPQDVLVIARPSAAGASYGDVARELSRVLKIDLDR